VRVIGGHYDLTTHPFSNPVPCLPARDEFHPKRNQARQKLATLPTARFEDLSSDVYFELSRRYPEFKEEVNRVSCSHRLADLLNTHLIE